MRRSTVRAVRLRGGVVGAPVPAPVPASLAAGHLRLSAGASRRPWRHTSPALVCWLMAALDFAAIVLSALLTFVLYVDRETMGPSNVVYGAVTVGAALLMVVLGSLHGLYDEAALKKPSLRLLRALATWTCTLLAFLGGVFFLHAANWLSRGWVGLWFILGGIALCAVRLHLRNRIAWWRTQGLMRERVVVVGASDTVARLTSRLAGSEFEDAYEVLGVFDGEGWPEDAYGALPQLGPVSAVLDFVRDHQVEVVIVSTGAHAAPAVTDLCTQLADTPIKVHLCPDQDDPRLPVINVDLLGGVSLLQVNRPTLSETARITKGIEDRVLAGLLLLAASPVMALAALAIRLDSPGPVLFRQLRFGFNNRAIPVLKFRSMYVDRGDASGAQRTVRGDARVTRVGHILRRTSIDELPQLLNVLRGEMSLVGPRAHPLGMRVVDRLYHEAMPGYSRRHRVKPGLTGLAQINGCRGEIDTVEKAEARLRYDLEYVAKWSLLLDLQIIALTPFRAFQKVY